MKKISLKDKLETVGEIFKLKDNILKELPREKLFSESKEELCYYALKFFEFDESEIRRNDITSIENGCKKVLSLMGIDEDFDEIPELSIKPELQIPIDKFLHFFLELDELPWKKKLELKTQVRKDLDTIDNLIKDYEKNEFIKNGEKPRNHQQKTKFEFYERCILEKSKIENYLSSGLENRALEKASAHRITGFIESLLESFLDRPYKVPQPKSDQYFDNELIDKVSHRIAGKILIADAKRLKDIYKNDKDQFYRELEVYIPIESVLDHMLNKVKFLPYLSEQRKSIFEEIVKLYKAKMWFGFYALALTQIEGLFTEMCRVCNPNFSNNKAALPDKVELIRPFYQFSEVRLDYFQYHLPNLRNRFLHYGIDTNEKIEILCNEILYDLDEVVSIFSSLNLDANWLLQLIRKRDDADFMSISGLCFYFKMLNSVKRKKQFHFFEQDVKSLHQNYLPSVLYNLVYDLESSIKDILDNVLPVIHAQSALNGFEVDLENISFKTLADNKVGIKDVLGEAFNWQLKEQISKLLDINMLLNNYPKYLDVKFISDDTKNEINSLLEKYGSILQKIKLISILTKP